MYGHYVKIDGWWAAQIIHIGGQHRLYSTPWKVGRPWRKLGALSDIFICGQVNTGNSHHSQQMARDQATMQATNHLASVN
jgi:hypothetical protein